jgi:hypothetical protein
MVSIPAGMFLFPAGIALIPAETGLMQSKTYDLCLELSFGEPEL